MASELPYFIYYISLLFAVISCLYRFKVVDSAAKVLAILICCGFVNECAAYYLSNEYHNNLPLYAIYCFLEFSLTCLYFNKVIDVFISKNIGLIIMVIGLILGIGNLVFIQHLNSINFYFLFSKDSQLLACHCLRFSVSF